MKKCMDFEVEGVKTYRQAKEDLERGHRKKDCETRQLCKEDAVDSRKWRKLIKDIV